MSWERVIEIVQQISPYPHGMYQPIEHPFFNDWVATEPCADRLQTVLEYVESVQSKTVLDIGCNLGYFSHKLAQMGAQVVGVDVEPLQVEVCRLLNACYGLPPGNPQFYCLSYQQYLEPDHQFDLTLSLNVFHLELRADADAAWRSLDLISRHTDLLLIALCEDTARMRIPDWRPELMLEHTEFTQLVPLKPSRRPRMLYALRKGR